MALCIWASTMTGFTTGPQSTAQTTRCTRGAPSDPTETSATSATKLSNDLYTAIPRPRPAASGVGQLVDEALDHEGVERVVHRAPEADRNAGVGEHVVHLNIGDGIGHLDATLHRLSVEPVLHEVGEHAGHDRRRDDAVRPCHRLAGSVETRLEPVVTGGAVLRVSNVVLAGPNHLHWCACGFGRLARFLDEVELEPAAEAATQIGRVHLDLFGRDTPEAGAQALRAGLQLGLRPDF